ncbi:MAG: cyclic pyranopterin monophosphate synthase MoaC [Blastopirellula sp.]|nr:cyclic pyranopterin monophosphate synthase MoaC [Blastopirellula sp.]
MPDFTHFDDSGASRMVDVGSKAVTTRVARASGSITMLPQTLQAVRDCGIGKGNVLEVARLAGIMAAKRTADLIPLCHPLGLDAVEIDFRFDDETTIHIVATARVTARTGVEMEAMVAVSTAALTIYDMCKSIDRGMVVKDIQLDEKSGGKSGHYIRSKSTDSEQ